MTKHTQDAPPSRPSAQAAPQSPTQNTMQEVPSSSSSLHPPGRPLEINTDKTTAIKAKVDTATKTMEQNIQAATQRGESLNDLQDKTQAVAESSKQFSKSAKTVQKNLWWKDIKFTFLCVLAVIIVIVIIVGAIYFNR